ncbi:MAG: PKD domain-containing protein, partial [Bacteroidetes bacterium]
CRGQSVSLNALGMDQYTWAPTEGLNLTTGSLVKASPRQTTIYTVTGRAGEGCVITRQVTVKVEDASSSISLVADRNALCPGESTEIRASGAAGYRWSPAATLNRSEGDVVVAKPETTTTYTLTALTSAGCQVEKSITLTASPKPELRATADKSLICANEPLRLSAYGASRLSWSPEALIVNASGNTASVRTDRTTLFTVIGENEAGCEDTARIEIIVREAPKLTVTPAESVICQGSQTEIKASGAVSYVWSPADGLNTTSGDRVMARPYRSQTYTVQARDIAGCISTVQAKVTVSGAAYPVPDFSSDASENFACAGQAITFRNESTQAYSCYWEFPGGTPATSTEQNPVVRYNSEGPKDVVLTVTGCNGLRERKVGQGYLVITPPMFFSLNAENVSVCRDEPFRLVASGAETYTWSPALGLDQTTGNVVMASPQVKSTYKVRGISRDGCIAEREVTLDVIGAGKKLKVSPSAPAICQGQSTQLTASGAVSYRWSPATGLNRTDGPSVQASPDRTTTYTVEGTDEDGCTFRVPVTVTVNQKNTLAISPDKPSICAGEEVVLRTSSRGVYQWTPNYGLSAATGSELRAFPRETTTYRVSGSNEHGCPAEASVTVTVQGGANVSLLARETRICEGSSTEVVISGGNSYQWSPIEGVSQGVGAVVSLAPAKTTTYTVTSGTGNCASRQTVTIEVIPSQPISILPEAPRVCPGQSIELEAVGAKAYIWDEAKGLMALAGSKVRVSPSQTTIYEVSGVDANGCEARGKTTVVVGSTDFLRLSASAATICKGSDVMLMAGGGESYEWIEGEGLNNRSAARVYARPQENASYRVVATDRYGCRDTASMRLNFEELRATFDASVTEIDLAEGEGTVSFADRTAQSVEWLWDFGDGGSSREAKPVHVYDRPGTYTVRMKVSNGACEAMTSRQIRVINSSNLEEVAASLLITLDESEQHVGFSLESPRRMLLSMRLLDASGREQISSLLRLGKGSFSREWDLSSFGKGEYTMELTDGARSVTRKVEVR